MKTSRKTPIASASLESPEPQLSVTLAPRKPRGKEKEHYVNGKEFEEEIRKYYNTDECSDNLATSISKIANGLSYAPNFINYSYKEDMVSDAVVKMFSALKKKKFKLDSGFSPFSYFTTIAFHAFINRIKKEKKYHETVTEYKEQTYQGLIQSEKIPHGGIYIEPLHDESDFNE